MHPTDIYNAHVRAFNIFKERAPRGSILVFTGIVGSHAYGTADEASDLDIAGAFIPPIDYLLGQKRIDQIEYKSHGECDITLYALPKLIALLSKCNPNIVEFLFLPDSLVWGNEYYERLITERHIFLSKRARYTFSGYAISQLKRIQRHRAWLLNPPKRQPTRADFDLPDTTKLSTDVLGAFNSLLAQRLEDVAQLHELRAQLLEAGDMLPGWDAIAQTAMDEEAVLALTDIPRDIVRMIMQEKAYQAALSHWKSYLNWKENRNPKRAEMEKQFGMDCKHASHLMRLIYEGKELLLTGKITLPCTEVALLKEIKVGVWSYERLMEEVNEIDREFDQWYKESPLPRAPNPDEIDKLCITLLRGQVEGNLWRYE